METYEQSEGKSLNEILKQPDTIIAASWLKVAQLVMASEEIPWKKASEKGREIYNSGEAPEYIALVRESATPKSPVKSKKSESIVNTNRDQYSLNYKRLLKIVPELEQELETADAGLHGKSYATGYMDLHFDLVNKNKRGYYVALSHYYKQNGDMIPDPDMVIRVDVKNQIVEALTYQDFYGYKEVYDNYLNPQSVRPTEKKAQNSFLTNWLRNLIQQGHQIQFDEAEEKTLPKPRHGTGEPKTEEPQEKKTDNSSSKVSRLESANANQLYKINYQLLLRLIPEISDTKIETLQGTLKSKNGSSDEFYFDGMEPTSKTVQTLCIHGSDTGLQFLGINTRSKKVWLLGRVGNFDGKPDYEEQKADTAEKLKANKHLGKWLDSVVGKKFKATYEDIKPETDDEWDEDANSKIPDYEPGKVELHPIHEKLGLDQKDIDWINEHQMGMTLTPVKNMKNNTENFFADMATQAMKPGFRISKTGKLYRENRSNRSDLTDKGL